MNTLEKIIADKYLEVEARKQLLPAAMLEKSSAFSRTPFSLKSFLLDPNKSGIITEFKRKSPSKGLINGTSSVEVVCKGYEQAGASALSVLTDQDYFGGSTSDLELARKQVTIPILRKDFVVDEYQIYLAPVLLGGSRTALTDIGVGTIADAHRLDIFEIEQLGNDLFLRARRA